MIKYFKQKGKHGEIRVTPRPTSEELDLFYQETYFSEGVSSTYSVNYSVDELSQKKLRADVAIEALIQALPKEMNNLNTLEIGSGEGFLLAAAERRGLSMLGIDYQSAPIERHNPNILNKFIKENPKNFIESKIKSSERYDGIALLNVLEHVVDPEKLLASLSQLLEPQGVAIVQVPNDFSDLQELAKVKGLIDREPWFCPPQHLTYWNSNNIIPFMAEQGFEIVDSFSDFPIEVFLWGGATNYVKDPSCGPLAHLGRVELDLFFSRAGLLKYLELYRSFFRVGFGRNITVIMKKSDKNNYVKLRK